MKYHNFLAHARGTTVSRASLLLLAFRSPRGAINCTRWLYVPSHPTVERLINSLHFPNSLSESNPVCFFSCYIRPLRGITFPFLEKTLKRSRALQHFLSRNTQKSIAISVRIPGGSFESSRGLELTLPISVHFPCSLTPLLCCSPRPPSISKPLFHAT